MTTSRSAPHAADLTDRAAKVLAGGATHAARSYHPAIHVARSQGARKWLVDGRELVDYTMGHGALLLGHAHPAVVDAVQRQVAMGTHFGAASLLEVEWAELICAMVASVEQVRFTASGTEAGMLATRLARNATGRDVVLKLEEHFHGWYDSLSVVPGPQGAAVPPPGVPMSVAAATRVVASGDLAALRAALADRTVAAMFIEASGAHYGREQLDPAYVRAAASLCAEHGTLFVVDEVVTGFRVAPGGMQAAIGVQPDLSTFGKIMAGGLPGGAVGGRRDVMDLLGVAADGDPAPAGPPHIVHPGTFNANPLSAAAGIATLRLVEDGSAQRTAEAYAMRLEASIRDALADAGVAGRVWRLASIVHCELPEAAMQSGLSSALREEGVDLLRTSAFCSVVHGDAELAWTRAAFDRALRRLPG
ncbi:MAG TPA: aminotransferase class III-fold pyridoxal phosphate-dependent enzyme [Candidatus Dormibacteraeota bacterium]|jgi:glutamate-1-semialdehyde 2,1-aminomutase|nr:aminotransferase class III-fold pyridoxal phosphate-dependent enzyme [Candidatus Dormibacteraeota bacterium]